MTTRRKFIKSSLAGLGALVPFPGIFNGGNRARKSDRPIVVSTWDFGQPANEAAWKVLGKSGSSIDAVEQGVRVPEGDPDVQTVGYGGYPDRDGNVTLDACIQDQKGDAGSVTFLRHIKHPVSVARKVKEESPHVMLTGEGALDFALDQGFEKQNLLTDE
jgi:L-asparaginase/N4-(beta-N-acetylglucosaminyl)-L-asparaginase